MSRKILGFVALATCIALGVSIRFRGLDQQSQLLWDEGLFDTGARFLSWRFHEPDAPASEYDGYPVFNEKPLHVLLLALTSEALGFQPLTGRLLSAAFATATLILVAARLMMLPRSGPIVAAVGSLALGGSVYHAYYSRLGLHEVDSVFWLLAACTVAQMGRGGRIPSRPWPSGSISRGFWSGWLCGLCLGSSYRWLPFLPLVAALAAMNSRWAARSRHLSETAARESAPEWEPLETSGPRTAARWVAPAIALVTFLIGIATVLIACEALYFWAFSPDFLAYQPDSYYAALASKFRRETHFVFEDAGFFFALLLELDGPLWLVGLASLGIVGLGLRGARCQERWLALEILSFTLLPLALFSISEAKVSRAVSVICPWIALGVGAATQRLLASREQARERVGSARGDGQADAMPTASALDRTELRRHAPRPALAAAFVAVVVASGIWSALRAWQLPLQLRSGYAEALDFVLKQGPRHLSSQAPISAAIAGRRTVVWASLPRRALPSSTAELVKTRQEGAEFLILDWEKYLWYNPFLANLEASQRPVLVLGNDCVEFPALLHESFLPADARALRATAKDLREIRVYDLRGWR